MSSSSSVAVNRHDIIMKLAFMMPSLFNQFAITKATALLPKSVAPGFARLTHVFCFINRGEGSFLFPLHPFPLRLLRAVRFVAPPLSLTSASSRAAASTCLDQRNCGVLPHPSELR